MKMTLDCIPCFVRQALESARSMTSDPTAQEAVMRDTLRWLHEADLDESPLVLSQRLHRRLRQSGKLTDPYREVKARHNAMALDLLPQLRDEIASSGDPLATAVCMAAAGNVIDMGIRSMADEDDVLKSLRHAMEEPFVAQWDAFRRSLQDARTILYLADNAGEIAFDRLLIEQIGPSRVTVAVRGGPVLNDATLSDARSVGLHKIAEVVENGSDAPGTLLDNCYPEFRKRFEAADMVIAKGQGNFESLAGRGHGVFFLFKVKCPVVASQVGQPVGTHILGQFKESAHPGKPEKDVA